MKNTLFIVVLLSLLSYPVIGKAKSIYLCKDTKGDLKGPKREFLIDIKNENYLFLKFISEGTDPKTGATNHPKINYKVVHKSSSIIIAIADYQTGVATISFNYSKKNNAVSIRTFITEEYAFAEHSTCFLQN